jgi:hypothetical protein
MAFDDKPKTNYDNPRYGKSMTSRGTHGGNRTDILGDVTATRALQNSPNELTLHGNSNTRHQGPALSHGHATAEMKETVDQQEVIVDEMGHFNNIQRNNFEGFGKTTTGGKTS